MQINLPDDTAALASEKALAAGFGDHLEAYVTYLIASDECSGKPGPAELSLAGKNSQEVAAMIEAGYASGPATPMTKSDWQQLHHRN